MFTKAERLRAIELYFKCGRKLAPVARELGYPSKRNLRRWIRLWEASDKASLPSSGNKGTCAIHFFVGHIQRFLSAARFHIFLPSRRCSSLSQRPGLTRVQFVHGNGGEMVFLILLTPQEQLNGSNIMLTGDQ